MPKKLHIDIETYSSEDIMKVGAYKYCASIDFEILLVAYAFDEDPIQIVDLASGETLPIEFLEALQDPEVEKHAHNANFERTAFKTIGLDIPVEQWYCSAVKAAYCGLPLSLAMVSEALKLEEKGKLSIGKALIRYFCVPIKPTKTNNNRFRNFPHHDFEKWESFKAYCINDVEAEREIGKRLSNYSIPKFERLNYILDQNINDRGILVDLDMAKNATKIDSIHSTVLTNKIKDITGLDNPNSAKQLKEWLSEAMEKEIESLAKDKMQALLDEAVSAPVLEVLNLRKKASKTSVKKYIAMRNCAGYDQRIRGLFQFYGANRTGRWAGRLVQMQNLPQNHLSDLTEARNLIKTGDYEIVSMVYDDVANILSQLIRTTFIAPTGHTFAVADFSAIEARVIAWLADESWRLEVFETHGKIYEASASMMFGIPIEKITKGSPERQKGKVAELALGYQGALGALKKMGGEAMGLSETEMTDIVDMWRSKNPNIVALWRAVNNAAIASIKGRKDVILKKFKNLAFACDGEVLTIQLPSGRKLYYQSPEITINRFGQPSVKYKGVDQVTKKWWWVDSYGGKFVENCVQAIARDLLAHSMLLLDREDFKIVLHVHDEVVAEIPEKQAEDYLKNMCHIMGQPVPWAPGLKLTADGYITNYYRKD